LPRWAFIWFGEKEWTARIRSEAPSNDQNSKRLRRLHEDAPFILLDSKAAVLFIKEMKY
jgi:hypothetical protein